MSATSAWKVEWWESDSWERGSRDRQENDVRRLGKHQLLTDSLDRLLAEDANCEDGDVSYILVDESYGTFLLQS